jgi:hypothetical protein
VSESSLPSGGMRVNLSPLVSNAKNRFGTRGQENSSGLMGCCVDVLVSRQSP